MVTVKIYEDDLLDLLVDRVKYWRSDPETIAIYTAYYRELIDCGCFEGMELDIPVMVDNDIVNYTAVITADEFSNYKIDGDDDERILAQKGDLYLISTC